MNFVNLAPDATRASELLAAVARARGCKTSEEIAAFLDPLPAISNPFRDLVGDYVSSRDRVARAIAKRETVVVYGDTDADGICALVQVVRFLRITGANVRWFVPTRPADVGGLTSSGVARCISTHNPSLLITVDCGSNAWRQVASLAKTDVDTIVLDHHSLTLTSPGALAHLNPKAYDPAHDVAQMSAAGLAFLWCDALAQDLGMSRQWLRIRDGSLVLAGLGTITDQVPVLGTNRALIKQALHIARQPILMERTPGLVALAERGHPGDITARTFTAEWGPRINACGRMSDPTIAIQLLLSPTLEEARPLAALCDSANSERRSVQEMVCREATEQADRLLQRDPTTRILVLADRSWHPGVVSAVASSVMQQFNRPTIVLAWSEDPSDADGAGQWAGSGRSRDPIDLNCAVQSAIAEGIVQTGGGHPQAIGLRLGSEKIGAFRDHLQAIHANVPLSSLQPTHEVIGMVDDMAPESWLNLFSRLAPFGIGNPMPYIAARRAKLAQPPYPRRSRECPSRVFAMTGLFRPHAAISDTKVLQFDWFDPERANHVWFPGRSYDLLLTLGSKRSQVSPLAAPVYNYRVAHCEPAA